MQFTLPASKLVGSLLLLSLLCSGCNFYPDEPHYLGLEYKSQPERLCPALWYDSVKYGMIKGTAPCYGI